MGDVDEILRRYSGKHDTLWARLQHKYHQAPTQQMVDEDEANIVR